MSAQIGEFLSWGVVGLGLVLVAEGLIYAIFPEGMKRVLALAQEMPAPTLRVSGLAAAIAGLGLLWLMLAI